MKNIMTLEEMYKEVSQKWNVDFEDGSVNVAELVTKGESLGYTSFSYGYGGEEHFIKDAYLRELNDEVCEAIEDYEGLEGLECNWLEGDEPGGAGEWVLNVGSIIIIDDLTEEVAEGLFNKIAYDM
jgi:hypothetical protein